MTATAGHVIVEELWIICMLSRACNFWLCRALPTEPTRFFLIRLNTCRFPSSLTRTCFERHWREIIRVASTSKAMKQPARYGHPYAICEKKPGELSGMPTTAMHPREAGRRLLLFGGNCETSRWKCWRNNRETQASHRFASKRFLAPTVSQAWRPVSI